LQGSSSGTVILAAVVTAVVILMAGVSLPNFLHGIVPVSVAGKR
jgi:hypothetical protein